MIGILFIIFLILILLNVPIAFSLGISSVAYLLLSGDVVLTLVPQNMVKALDSFPLMAAPFFILAGKLMEHGGISKRLISFAESIVGQLRGGLAHVGVITCMFFAALSGSGSATTAAIGGLLIPAMAKVGYKREFSTAVVAASGTTGIIIPPSVPLILYGVTASVSVSKLFIAGVIPGILIGISFMLVCYIIALINDYKADEKTSINKIWHSLKDSILALLMPVIILGGIYGGIFTPTEASVVAVVYGFLVGAFIYKELDFSRFKEIFVSSAVTSSVILLLIATASIFGMVLTRERIPHIIAGFIGESSMSDLTVILLIIVFLLIVGTFMETIASIIILTPLLVPVAVSIGMDPVHFGVVMIVNLAIGLITPPVGVNIFVGAQVGHVAFDKLVKALLPFIIMMIVDLLIIIFIPSLSMYFVDIFDKM